MDAPILTVLLILAVTVTLLALEIFRLDVTALLCLLALAWTDVLEPQEALSGFASNAVVAMMAVMILGRGLARTGLMDRFARFFVRKVGDKPSRIVALLSLSVGLLSGFIQNVGAAALFLPAILDISRRQRIPASTLVMPIGFAAILGGTLSMVGSGPLILINDLLRVGGQAPYGLLSVTPVGLALLGAGIFYFVLLGKMVLPDTASREVAPSEQERLVEALHLPDHIWLYTIPASSSLVGQTPEEAGLWSRFGLNLLGLARDREIHYAPWRQTRFEAGQTLALLGEEAKAERFAATFDLRQEAKKGRFAPLRDPKRAGFAEVIIPPRSALVGQTLRSFALRRRYAVEPVLMFNRGEEVRGDFSDRDIAPGDTFILYGLWENIDELKGGGDFLVATPFSPPKQADVKSWPALLCFAGAVGLALAGFPLSQAFLTGALAMILTGVLSIEAAYEAIEWKVVFLLAGLIPLGLAMQKTGAAEFLARQVMTLVQGAHPLLFLLSVAILSTFFSLFMSNVGAIVVLAPLVIGMAELAGLPPRPLVLLAAICAANSFMLPTHQVNVLYMSPGGYRNADYLRAGGGLTLLFLLVVVTLFYFFYL
ncbi:MAG: SLC13 family permease [Desulfuromonadales bacterium]